MLQRFPSIMQLKTSCRESCLLKSWTGPAEGAWPEQATPGPFYSVHRANDRRGKHRGGSLVRRHSAPGRHGGALDGSTGRRGVTTEAVGAK